MNETMHPDLPPIRNANSTRRRTEAKETARRDSLILGNFTRFYSGGTTKPRPWGLILAALRVRLPQYSSRAYALWLATHCPAIFAAIEEKHGLFVPDHCPQGAAQAAGG